MSAAIHPHDRLNRANNRLTFLNTLLALSVDQVKFEHPDNQAGLYSSLRSISDDIESALCELQNTGVAA